MGGVDHYLGKELIQNLLYFRFANTFLVPFWNRTFIESTQITMAESFGVKKNSSRETFAALQLEIDNWRWAGVPIFIRAGKKLAMDAQEVTVRLRRPPLDIFSEPRASNSNHVRFRLGPDRVEIAIGARVKQPGETMASNRVELEVASDPSSDEPPYERLIGDALGGDQELFARSDEVRAA